MMKKWVRFAHATTEKRNTAAVCKRPRASLFRMNFVARHKWIQMEHTENELLELFSHKRTENLARRELMLLAHGTTHELYANYYGYGLICFGWLSIVKLIWL